MPDAPLYLMPSIAGGCGVPRRTWMSLLEKVEKGAVLYFSLEDGIVAELERIAGVEIIHRSKRSGPITAKGEDRGETFALSCETPVHMKIRATRATVLASEEDGNPAITVVDYGKGRVFFSTLPLELSLAKKEGSFHGPRATPAWKFWQRIAEAAALPCALTKRDGRDVLLSEHPESEKSGWAIAFNAADSKNRLVADLAPGWKATFVSGLPGARELDLESGSKLSLEMAPWSAAVLRLAR